MLATPENRFHKEIEMKRLALTFVVAICGLAGAELTSAHEPVIVIGCRPPLWVPPPPPPPIPPISYEIQDWFIPPHVAGDAEFGGIADIWLNVVLYIHPHARHEVWARIEMRAVEPK